MIFSENRCPLFGIMLWRARSTVPRAGGDPFLPADSGLRTARGGRAGPASGQARIRRRLFLCPDARPMPKRTDIETILIIGAGPIVIGQACEFDYSGTQACKALKAEGYRGVLVN